MKDAKNKRKIVQLEESYKVENIRTNRKIIKRIMSFDAYFQVLMKRNAKILMHHKAPMRKYAEAQGIKETTLDEFDRIFRVY